MSESLNRDIGRLIKRKRIMMGISQEQLGKLMGVTFQQVQKYESGMNGLSIVRLLQLLPLIGQSLTDFLNEIAGASSPEMTHLTGDCEKLLRSFTRLSTPEREAITAFAQTLVKSKQRIGQ